MKNGDEFICDSLTITLMSSQGAPILIVLAFDNSNSINYPALSHSLAILRGQLSVHVFSTTAIRSMAGKV
jgi:hypothetical protein